MELGPSRWAKNTLLKSAKIFHYRQAHSENFQNFDFSDKISTLTKLWAEENRRRQLRGQLRPPPFVDSSGGGISALRLVRSVHSCGMLAKSVFFLKTKVLCPAAASGVFFRPKNGPGPEKVEHFSAKMQQVFKNVVFTMIV